MNKSDPYFTCAAAAHQSDNPPSPGCYPTICCGSTYLYFATN